MRLPTGWRLLSRETPAMAMRFRARNSSALASSGEAMACLHGWCVQRSCRGPRQRMRARFVMRGRAGEWAAEKSAAVEVHFLAVGHDDVLEPENLLAVGELISGRGDDVARLERVLHPAVG